MAVDVAVVVAVAVAGVIIVGRDQDHDYDHPPSLRLGGGNNHGKACLSEPVRSFAPLVAGLRQSCAPCGKSPRVLDERPTPR